MLADPHSSGPQRLCRPCASGNDAPQPYIIPFTHGPPQSDADACKLSSCTHCYPDHYTIAVAISTPNRNVNAHATSIANHDANTPAN